MKFLTKTWIQTQFSNFAARIALIFAKKTETNEHFTQKSTQSILGHVKLSDSSAITISGEYALDAIEKNASVAGTLANMINQANTALDKRVTEMEQKSFYEDQIEVSVSLTETDGLISNLFNDEVDFSVIKNGDCIYYHTYNAIYIQIRSEKAVNYIDVSLNISTDYLIDGIIKFTLFTLDISKADFRGLDAPQPVSNTIASIINNRVGLRFKYPRDTMLNELMGLELSLEVIGKIKKGT